jgi:hypothetical protein
MLGSQVSHKFEGLGVPLGSNTFTVPAPDPEALGMRQPRWQAPLEQKLWPSPPQATSSGAVTQAVRETDGSHRWQASAGFKACAA